MKIGIDARLWNETGVGRYIRNLVWQLQEIDHTNEYVLFVQPGFKNNGKWKIVETDIHWHSLNEQLKFSQILYRENLDLMHFPYFSVPVNYNKPYVVTIHDLIIKHFPTGKASTLPFPLYWVKWLGYSFILNKTIHNAQKIIVPLNAVKNDILQMYKVSRDNIVVTKEGIDSSLQKKQGMGVSQYGKYFLYVGNAYPHKNLEKLIEAFILFRSKNQEARVKDLKLVLVGKNDYFYKKLKEHVKDSQIIFLHDVTDKELVSLYSHATAFVSASLMEGFGLPPLEAMSLSCPVLLSDIPAFREVCGDVPFYFDPNSVEDIKEKMVLLYNLDQRTKQNHIREGLERVKIFSWKKMAEQTKKVYESSISI